MIDTARRRMQTEDPEAPIEFEVLATEQLSKLDVTRFVRRGIFQFFRLELCCGS